MHSVPAQQPLLRISGCPAEHTATNKLNELFRSLHRRDVRADADWMSNDAIQDDVPLLDGVVSIKPAHKHVASIAAPAGRLLRRLSKLRNVPDETIYVANRNCAAAIRRVENRRNLTINIADIDRWPTGRSDSEEFAWDHQALEFGPERNQMKISNTETLHQPGRGLVRPTDDVGQAQGPGTLFDQGEMVTGADEQKDDVAFVLQGFGRT
jgi:hypothetical protein